MAVYSTLILFKITFKPWLSVRVFLQGCLASSVHEVAHKMYQPWNGKMSVFLIVEKTRTKKLKLLYKVAAKVPFRQVQFVRSSVQFTLQEFFSSLLLCTLPCMNFFLLFPLSHHFCNDPSLKLRCSKIHHPWRDQESRERNSEACTEKSLPRGVQPSRKTS